MTSTTVDETLFREVVGHFTTGVAIITTCRDGRRYGVTDVLTLDERHFRAIQGARGRPFRILPADG